MEQTTTNTTTTDVIDLTVVQNILADQEFETNRAGLLSAFLKMFQNHDAQEIMDLINKNKNMLKSQFTKLNDAMFSKASVWFSYFHGNVYVFAKYYKKNYVQKFPNFVIEGKVL